jgi:hypothetical protein
MERSPRMSIKQYDYNKADGIIKNMKRFNKKNILIGVIGYILIFIVNHYTEKDIIWSLTTLFFMFGWSYFSHIISHQSWGKHIFMNFHPIHHDHSQSKIMKNRLLEYGYMDFVIFGGAILIPLNILFEGAFGGDARLFNYYIILYWSLIYSSYHAFNWHFTDTLNPHYHHHMDTRYNYGPDFMDILFDTKMDNDIIEDMNSLVLNNFGVILLFGLCMNWKIDPIKGLRSLIVKRFV